MNGTSLPADMRDIHSVRNALGRVEDKVDALAGRVDTSLLIQTHLFEELMGRGVETIPGVGPLARREARRKRALEYSLAAVAVLALVFFGSYLGRAAADRGQTTEVHHAP